MSKRRVFDIDFPVVGEGLVTADSDGAEAAQLRRGPMASAIAENAGALGNRQTTDAAIRAENDALAHEHVRLKKLGLIMDRIPLEKIRARKLIRDRTGKRDEDIDELKASILAVGLSNPIRVEEAGNGTYELVQGFRRTLAYRELLEETGDVDRFGAIPAGLVAKGATIDALYRRMVDENLVRKDISFAEMAELAVAYAEDDTTAAATVDQAVDTLFASAGRQKRVYIRRFAALLGRLGGHLSHSEVISRALGLALLKRIERIPGTAARIQLALSEFPHRTAAQELDILNRFADAQVTEMTPGLPTLEETEGSKPVPKAARTVVSVARPEGTAKVSASDGKVEIRLKRNFSAEERHRLEAAVEAFFAKLDW